MEDDPIIAEVRQARAAHAQRFGNDLERIYRDIKTEERKSGRKYKTFPTRHRQAQNSAVLKEQREKYGDESQG